MRRSKEEAASTRRRIVNRASRLFRGRGIASVSIADVMGSLGLTVGGFYRHFGSKEALVAEAIDAASLETTRSQDREASAALDSYLSNQHRARADLGCPVAALCSEAGHEGRSTKQAFTVALRRLIDEVAGFFGTGTKQEHDDALFSAAALVGALVLSRATVDDALARRILGAVKRGLRERLSHKKEER